MAANWSGYCAQSGSCLRSGRCVVLLSSFVSGAALRLSATPLLTSSRLAPSLVSSWFPIGVLLRPVPPSRSSGPPPRFLATTPPPTTIPPLDPPPRGPAPSVDSEGVGVGGTGACGASPEGVGAEDVGARAGVRGVRVVGAGEAGAGVAAEGAAAAASAAIAALVPVVSTSSISTPITDYYRATRRVVTRVLASLVTDRRASSSFISALNATVTDFAATRHLDYATRMVPAHPLSARIGSALGYDVLEDRQFELEFLVAASPHLCTYDDAVPPLGGNVVNRMGIFKHSETTSYTAFLKGRLHGEIWMRRSPGINYHFPSSDPMERRPVYGLCQAPHEWHDTLRTTLATLGFSSSYAEIVGCLMYYMTCTRLDLAFPLGVLSRFDATRRHRLVHWSAPVRVAKYLVTTPGMWLVLGGTQPIVLTEHCNSSYAHDVETQRSTQGYCFNLGTGAVLWRSTRSLSLALSSAEADIDASAMAA
ncbi:unnamed protein product [Closterium sp. NIES-53]